VVDRLDVHYQPGHINASQSETRAADGKYLAVGCKFSKDRFLPVGPLHPENEQLIDISGDKMVLLADHPVRGEPHDFIIFKRDLLKPKQVYDWTTSRWRSRIPRSLASPATARRSRSR
jgi:nitrous-oxide reductase